MSGAKYPRLWPSTLPEEVPTHLFTCPNPAGLCPSCRSHDPQQLRACLESCLPPQVSYLLQENTQTSRHVLATCFVELTAKLGVFK